MDVCGILDRGRGAVVEGHTKSDCGVA